MIIEEKKAVITIEPLPEVLGLSTQLRQLFYNLVNNALKFNTALPLVTISSKLMPDEKDQLLLSDNYNIISIADNGIGIDSQYSTRIFNMFQRLHERDQYGGNGIGLALCRRIIENHNGVINFTSTPGKGTVFWIYLPKKQE